MSPGIFVSVEDVFGQLIESVLPLGMILFQQPMLIKPRACAHGERILKPGTKRGRVDKLESPWQISNLGRIQQAGDPGSWRSAIRP